MSLSVASTAETEDGPGSGDGLAHEAAAHATAGRTDAGRQQQPPLRLLPLSGEVPHTLPTLATAGDVREVVQYLKKKPSGVSIIEAADDVKRRIFEQRKVAAYEFWGIIERHHDRLALSPLGWEFARKLEPEAAAYRALLRQAGAYHAALEWIHRHDSDLFTHTQVSDFWRQVYGGTLDPSEKAAEGSVVCFFHLCQAAGLGTMTIGKRGQPARLRVDREELKDYFDAGRLLPVADVPDSGAERGVPIEADVRGGDTEHRRRMTDAAALRVLVSVGAGAQLVGQVNTALDLAGHEHRVFPRGRPASGPFSEHLVSAMRECEAALFFITSGDCLRSPAGELVPGPDLLAQICAAFVLYERRVALLCEKGITRPPGLKELPSFTFERGGLTWEVGIGLLKVVKDFRESVRREA